MAQMALRLLLPDALRLWRGPLRAATPGFDYPASRLSSSTIQLRDTDRRVPGT